MQENHFTDWLLNAQTPSIRYQTLVDLLGYPEDDNRVGETRREIMEVGPVPAIQAKQSEAGNWVGDRSYYTPKFVSTHWSMMLLAELDVDGTDAGFQQGARFMLEATGGELNRQLDTGDFRWSCFWGNMLRYGLQAGQGSDDRLQKVVHYLALDFADGPCSCSYTSGLPCAWGVVRSLWGLAAIPQAKRSSEVEPAIARGVKFLLDDYHLVAADYPTREKGKVSGLWSAPNFPLFYQADILFTLRVLDELGELGQPGAQPALDWLEQHRGKDGRWSGRSPFRLRTWRKLGDQEETARWVSLQASRILQHAGRF